MICHDPGASTLRSALSRSWVGGPLNGINRAHSASFAPGDRMYRTVPGLPSAEVSLASLLAAGRLDELAFADLYTRTSRLVLGTVRRVLRDHAQADEVVQEVYLQAWEKAASYRGDLASVTTWLLVIARRRAIDRVRSNASLTARDTAHCVMAPTITSSTEADVLRRAEITRLNAALARLSDAQRQTLILSQLGGYTHPEIAALLGIPLGTVKSRIRQGMHLMRLDLERRSHRR